MITRLAVGVLALFGVATGSAANGADVSESEGRHDFLATKDGDLNRIRVGNERYEIPDAVVLGG